MEQFHPPLPFHPCISEAAHHTVPRLHLPVAPQCNLSCAFCTREIGAHTLDLPGPGKAEHILTPPAALEKARAFVDAWGPGAVIGIAGPGDPLANPETIDTLERVRDAFPGLTLCLCTNGLALPRWLPDLVRLRIGHLSVTVNGVDPEIVSEIQPWIRVNDEVIHGADGARLLIETQMRGIQAAAEAGIFVKINTVVVPGVNDLHMPDIAKTVKRKGAGILNPMPLIPGGKLAHVPRPGPGFMRHIHDLCTPFIPTFRSCRQCRADAAGIPGKENILCQNTA